MSFDREWELAKWQQWVDGDTEALGELYKCFGGLIASVVRQFDDRGRDVDELKSEASVGFMIAVIRYRPELGSLAGYVATWVRARMIHFLARHRSKGMVARTGDGKLLKAARDMEAGNAVDEKTAEKVRRRKIAFVSVSAGADDESDPFDVADDAPTPEEQFEQLQAKAVMSSALRDCIYNLSEAQRTAIVDVIAGVSTSETAKERGVSTSAVRLNRRDGERNLRKLMMQRPDVAELVGTILDRGSLRT